MPEGNRPRRKIGFNTSYDEHEVEPMREINNEEEDTQKPAMLDDYIPGGVYDGTGKIVTYESFEAEVKKTKAEIKSIKRNSLAKLILYTSLGVSALLLSYGAYKKYLAPAQKQKMEFINKKER